MFQLSEKLDLLGKSLAQAQSEFSTIPKSGYNPHFKSNFSTYNDIKHGTDGALKRNDLSVSHYPVSEGDQVGVVTVLMHASGQFIASRLLMKPSRPGPQEAGSIITYFKRYGRAAVLGIEGEIDDDGNAASGVSGKNEEPHYVPVSTPSAPANTTTVSRKIADPRPPKSGWEPKYPRPQGAKANEPIAPGAAKFWWILIKECGWGKEEAKDYMEARFGYANPEQFTKGDFWDFEYDLRKKDREELLSKARQVKAEPASMPTDFPPFTDNDQPFDVPF